MTQSITPDTNDGLLEYFWPHPYPQHKPPTQVTFSNGLPTSDNDREHLVFVVPYHTFKTAINALMLDTFMELIGDNESVHQAKWHDSNVNLRALHQNELRNELRKAIQERLKP